MRETEKERRGRGERRRNGRGERERGERERGGREERQKGERERGGVRKVRFGLVGVFTKPWQDHLSGVCSYYVMCIHVSVCILGMIHFGFPQPIHMYIAILHPMWYSDATSTCTCTCTLRYDNVINIHDKYSAKIYTCTNQIPRQQSWD